jgi:cupredoxin-like protein
MTKIIIQLFLLINLFHHFAVLAKRPEFIIKIKDHLFFPAEIIIPENKKVKFIIFNADKTPEQFDSFDLNREKVIFAGNKSTIFIGPLPSGEYHFFGEYHPNTARGVVIVKNETKQTPLVKGENLTDNDSVNSQAKAGANHVD